MVKQPVIWYFRMPWHVEIPVLTNCSGDSRVALLDRGASRSTTMSLLDTPDERLSRAGIRLACQVRSSGTGWYVWGSSWQPWVPADPSSSMSSDSEMPDEIADMVRPFTRGERLVPVMHATRVRGSYELIAGDGAVAALLSNDRITVRHKHEAAGRAHELSVDVSRLDRDTKDRLSGAIEQMGGVRVQGFDDLFSRAGSFLPAAGAGPSYLHKHSIGRFISKMIAARMTQVLVAALTVRSDSGRDTTPLLDSLGRLQSEIGALTGVLDSRWCTERVDTVDGLLSLTAGEVSFTGPLKDLLDALDAASLDPPLVVDDERNAGEVLGGRVGALVDVVRSRIDGALAGSVQLEGPARNEAALDGPAVDDIVLWRRALDASTEALRLADLARPALDKGNRLVRVLGKVVALLSAAQPQAKVPTPAQLQALSPAQAFAEGRAVEQAFQACQAGRDEFREQWPHRSAQLAKALGAPEPVRG
ncbi:hypothetical protein [Propionibacterium sp.]|uniref:hypothetical protein n=1 Tax=Propionibacterium sp. TaxID=1977903 RepID=UPI0039ED5C3D